MLSLAQFEVADSTDEQAKFSNTICRNQRIAPADPFWWLNSMQFCFA